MPADITMWVTSVFSASTRAAPSGTRSPSAGPPARTHRSAPSAVPPSPKRTCRRPSPAYWTYTSNVGSPKSVFSIPCAASGFSHSRIECMPRRLLRDGEVVVDDWRTSGESGADDDSALLLTLDQWLADRERWIRRGGRLGVTLAPAHRVEM